MTLTSLDHVNLRTGNLAAMTAFYRDNLGLAVGPRPAFEIGGAWLYLGDQAAVHLVEVPATPEGVGPRLEHFAFLAEDLAGFLDGLRAAGVAYAINVIPGNNRRQVNIHDPDGNHIEIQFGAEEEADLSDFAG